jgi:hypothetical protein
MPAAHLAPALSPQASFAARCSPVPIQAGCCPAATLSRSSRTPRVSQFAHPAAGGVRADGGVQWSPGRSRRVPILRSPRLSSPRTLRPTVASHINGSAHHSASLKPYYMRRDQHRPSARRARRGWGARGLSTGERVASQLGSAWPLGWGARGLSAGERVASRLRLGGARPLGWGARGLSAGERVASRVGSAWPLGWGARGLSGGERVASRLGSAVGASPQPQLPMSRHRPGHGLADLPSHPRQRVAAKGATP